MVVGTVVNLRTRELVFDKKNRKIDSSHVGTLKNSLAKSNLLHLKPIIINKDKLIIDGQHRVLAASDLGIKEIPCLIVDGTPNDARALNQYSKNWSLINFAEYWASKGKKDYLQFLKFVEETGIKNSAATRILGKGESFRRANFCEGNFKVYQIQVAYAFADMLADFADKLPTIHSTKVYLTDKFTMSFWSFVKSTKNYSHSRMMRAVEQKGIKRCYGNSEYTKQFKNLYGE